MKSENRNVVRLSESQLKQIVAEELKKAMNEIGNTPFGQYMLGRTAARQKKYPDEDYISASKYADDRRHEYNMDDTNFQSGYRKQDDLQNSIDDYMLDEVYGELRKSAVANDIKRKKDDIKKDMHDLAYKSLPSYKKKVDDEENTKSKELKHQIRKKYSLNNPAFNKTNEAKLNSKIDRIVSESIDRILKNK